LFSVEKGRTLVMGVTKGAMMATVEPDASQAQGKP
jgi:hypothetical protein